MSNNISTLYLNIEVLVKQESGRWIVKSNQFKSFVYGNTMKEAEESFRQAVTSAVHCYSDRKALADYLDSTGVEYRFENEGDDPVTAPSHLEVAVAV